MYIKQLLGRRVRYFQYAPPLTRLDDAGPDVKRPNPPYFGAPLHTHSVYYFWWLFLKEHVGYQDCMEAGGSGEYAGLYKDFGDIRNDDFMGWWKKTGRDLFCEPPQAEIEVFDHVPLHANLEGRVLISVPLEGDLHRTVAELRQLLMPSFKQLTPEDGRSRARYQVASKPVLTSLHQHWLAHRARKEHPEVALHQLADLAGIAADAGRDANDRVGKILKTNKIKRYLKGSEALIRNVGLGKFPLFNDERDE